METYTREQADDMVREAVERTERSFGGTFKRLKAENEELRAKADAEREGREAERAELKRLLDERETELGERGRRIRELAVRAELTRQLTSGVMVPERFVDPGSIVYSDDPEELRRSVAEAVERARAEFATILGEAGIVTDAGTHRTPNPTNPAGRDGSANRDLRTASAREALGDMARRGLLK